jgi:hypothetical protein
MSDTRRQQRIPSYRPAPRLSSGRAGPAIDLHRSSGGTVLLATFTAAHTRADCFAPLGEAHRDAGARFWRQRSVRDVLKSIGCVGRVAAFAVTWGRRTGWHPHRHVLLFVNGGTNPGEVQRALADRWSAA